METFNLIAQSFYSIMLLVLLPVSVWIWTPHFDRPGKKVRNTKILLVFYHLMVLAELGVGNFGWATFWLIVTVMWVFLYKKYKEQAEDIAEFKEKVNAEVIKKIAEDFNLDPQDFSIVEKSYNEVEIHYKGKIFNAAEHKLQTEDGEGN